MLKCHVKASTFPFLSPYILSSEIYHIIFLRWTFTSRNSLSLPKNTLAITIYYSSHLDHISKASEQSFFTTWRIHVDYIYILFFFSEYYDYEADILDTEATRHCQLTGKCVIRVDSCGISITEVESHVTMCWPYTCVRKYGSMDDKIFFFECGRRCVTGEGRFVLMTHNAVILHQNMTNFIRRVEKKM